MNKVNIPSNIKFNSLCLFTIEMFFQFRTQHLFLVVRLQIRHFYLLFFLYFIDGAFFVNFLFIFILNFMDEAFVELTSIKFHFPFCISLRQQISFSFLYFINEAFFDITSIKFLFL